MAPVGNAAGVIDAMRGLRLAHRFVEDLGGTLRALNQVSGGADFVIELPVQRGSTEPNPGS